jgi:hypothetical protein
MRLQDGTAWLLTWQEQRHGDAYIFSVVVHMTKASCIDVCKYMIHIVVKGFDHQSSESLGTRMQPASVWLQGSRDREHKIGTYLFHN